MPRIEKLDGSMMFECPGCGLWHTLNVERDGQPKWSFNGNTDKPTFKPSLRVRWTHGEKQEKRTCHSFITDGQIRFLKDCTHELAGQTVDMIEIEKEQENENG